MAYNGLKIEGQNRKHSTGGKKMDREQKTANRVYIGVVVFITTVMLVGSAYIHHMPESFFA
jgi:hypothetical protein